MLGLKFKNVSGKDYRAIYQGESVVGKLWGFSNVFDNADHNIFLQKKDKYGKSCEYGVPYIVRSEARNRILNVNAINEYIIGNYIMNVDAVTFYIFRN